MLLRIRGFLNPIVTLVDTSNYNNSNGPGTSLAKKDTAYSNQLEMEGTMVMLSFTIAIVQSDMFYDQSDHRSFLLFM